MSSHGFEHTLQRWLLFFACLIILYFLFSMYHRNITLDDAWFAEQAYWFAKDGYVHSDLFEGFPIFAHQILVYHKLHIWQGAAAYSLFGWNAYIFKAIPLPYLVLFLVLIYRYLRQIAPIESSNTIFITFLFLFFINHLVFQEGFEFRPEIMMMCTGFISYLLLQRAQSEQHPLYAVLSGLLAGVTALFHLNGLIFILAGGFLLLLNKQYKLVLWFGLGSIIGFIPYFYGLASVEKLKEYIFALQHDPAVSEEDRSLSGWLKKLLFEYRRFTHHVYELSYLLVFLLTLFINWKSIIQNRHYKNLLLYALLLTIFMALITTGSKTSYLLYSMPYVLLLISIHFMRNLSPKKIGPVFLTIVIIYSLTNLDRDHGVITDEKYVSPNLNAHITEKYHIRQGEQIFAPATFVFNEIGKVHIQAYVAYLAKYHNDLSQVTLQNVFSDIYRRNKSYAILNKVMLKDFKFTPRENEIYYGYRYLGREGDLYIFKRLPGEAPVI